MSHRRFQTTFAVFILLVMISSSISFPADYQPRHGIYKTDYGSKDKRRPPHGARKGRRGYVNPVYSYGQDKEQRRDVSSYYEPNSE